MVLAVLCLVREHWSLRRTVSVVNLITGSSCHVLVGETEGRMKQVRDGRVLHREKSNHPSCPFGTALVNMKMLSTAPQPEKQQLCGMF